MRELVTFQVGSYANFVGSHFWNFQDELLGLSEDALADSAFKNQNLDMDVLYRAGETQQGIPTYTPRLVSVDLQGSLGSMSIHGSLYNQNPNMSSSVVTWTGNVSTQASKPCKKNLFLQRLCEEENDTMVSPSGITRVDGEGQSETSDKEIVDSLENDVQFWTDFSKVHYHPRSLYELNGLGLSVQEFNNYGIGREALSEGLQGDEIHERLRFFMEECDHVQGIQFIVDDSGGFSGVAVSILENIEDEYPNVPVLLYAVRSPNSHMNRASLKQAISCSLHDAVSFSRLSNLSKLIVPIGLPSLSGGQASRFLHIRDEKLYHSSAIYASAVHSVTLPFRMERIGPTAESYNECGAVDMYEGIQMLAGQARGNIVSTLDAAMPSPSVTGSRFQQRLLESLQSLTPETAQHVEDLHAVEFMIVHGALGAGDQRASISEVREGVHAAYENAESRPLFFHLSASRCPLPIPLPFPKIFGNLVGEHGELLSSPLSGPQSGRGSLDVHSVPMAARLRSSTAVLPFLENRLANIRKYGINRGAPGAQLLSSWGFGKEEIEDIGEHLSKMVTTLHPPWEHSSDSDSD